MILAPPADPYGVVTCAAPSARAAWRLFGLTVARQRAVQMEGARRQAWGRLAEVAGPSAAEADEEVLKTRYPASELQRQFSAMPASVRGLWTAYAEGATLGMREGADRLAKAGYPAPAPWTTTDSMAIAVRLFQHFGRGGAGELRNLAILDYLRARPNLKGRELDVLDDLSFREDPLAPTTLRGTSRIEWPSVSRAQTLAHLAALPKLSLFELLPGLRLFQKPATSLVAARLGTPDRTGSYAIVNVPRTGAPTLLSAPQMGFAAPGIVHPIRIESPEVTVEGMDVPGIPTVLIGATPRFAWGLTSGVADTDDVALVPAPDVTESRPLAVKGAEPRSVTYRAKGLYPVVIEKKGAGVFVRRTSYAGLEWRSLAAVHAGYAARTPREIERAIGVATMSFNYFYATPDAGGWRYVGRVDRRPPGSDPRFPKLGLEGYRPIPPAEMPSRALTRSKPGVLVNWNDKPAEGWKNGDTPVWGRVWRSREIDAALGADRSPDALVGVARVIAMQDELWRDFRAYAPAPLAAWDGVRRAGTTEPILFRSFVTELRKELFSDALGGFLDPGTFAQVLQPTVILNALEGRTRYDYLAGRSVASVVAAAATRAVGGAFRPGTIPGPPGSEPVPYNSRGTFIQAVRVLPTGVEGGNVLTPGAEEEGSHSADLLELARAWGLRPFAPLRVAR